MLVIGIDPGLSGAISLLELREGVPVIRGLWDIPTVGGKVFDYPKIKNIILEAATLYGSPVSWAFFEQTQALPPGKSVQASHKLGLCEGLFTGLFLGFGIRYVLIKPKAWQKYFSISKSKGDKKSQSYVVASRMFPDAQLTTPRGRKLDGRADSLLIAAYGSWFVGACKRILESKMKQNV